jgi:hypothetical protein
MGQAQHYVVTSITGKVTYEIKNSEKKELTLRQTLDPQTILDLPYKSQVELLDEQGKKKHTLKTPGRGALSDMLKDRQNSVIQLTEQYLAYIKARLRGKGELTSKRFSDPATVTREITVKEEGASDKFMAFRKQAYARYEEFRQKAISEYAAFMRKAWQAFEASPELPFPKDDKTEPIEAPVTEGDSIVKEEKAVQIEGAPLIASLPSQPVIPSNMIMEQEEKEGEYVEFTFYGTPLRIRFTHRELFKLDEIREEAIANAFERLQSADYNNTIRDCIEIRSRHQLCDWAYLKMIDAMSKACFTSSDEATLLMAFIYQQSGYKMRLGIANGQLVMLYASRHIICGSNYFTIDGVDFYPYNTNATRMNICEAAYPEEKPLSLWIPSSPMLAEDKSEARSLKSKRYDDIAMSVTVNNNLLAFYNDYPTSYIGEDKMSRWAIYANTPFEASVAETLLPAMREKISGLSENEAVERLLNWIQTGFEYKYDEEVWGKDRAFFADETLSYPYCDCEDRSILLSRLVHDLLGLPTLLVYYPGHLAMAVGFNEEVAGDYINLDGKRFVVCDPTYINAGVGQTMPKMDNKTAKVILLK